MSKLLISIMGSIVLASCMTPFSGKNDENVSYSTPNEAYRIDGTTTFTEFGREGDLITDDFDEDYVKDEITWVN